MFFFVMIPKTILKQIIMLITVRSQTERASNHNDKECEKEININHKNVSHELEIKIRPRNLGSILRHPTNFKSDTILFLRVGFTF